MKTRSGYMQLPWQIQLRDVPLADTPPGGEVLLRVLACGICGTDLTAAADHAKTWQPFGHEVAAVIEALGSGPRTAHLKVGKTVVLETSSFCGHCANCRNGRVDLCNKAPGFWGRPAMGFADRMLVPAACVVPYEGLAPDIASLAEPAGVAMDMIKTARIELGDAVAIVGPGPIGLMAAALALRSGAARVAVIGRSHSTARLDVARKLGAEPIAVDGPLAARADLADQFQHVLHTAPAKTIPTALPLLSYGGEMTYIGIGPGDGTISFDANNFHFRKLQLRASYASPAVYFPATLALLKSAAIPGPLFISHHFKLAELEKAMHTCRDDKAGVVKIIVEP